MIKQIETISVAQFSKQEMNGKIEVAVLVNGIYVRVFDVNGTATVYANTGRPGSSKKLGKKLTAQVVEFVKSNIEKF